MTSSSRRFLSEMDRYMTIASSLPPSVDTCPLSPFRGQLDSATLQREAAVIEYCREGGMRQFLVEWIWREQRKEAES